MADAGLAKQQGTTGEGGLTSPEPFDLINKSVVKATVLLKELARHRIGLTLTELTEAVGMTRPTVFRLLLTLEQTGFADRVDNRYTVGWQIGQLGRAVDPYTGAAIRVQPILNDYASKFNATLGFSLLKGDHEADLIAEASGSPMLNVSYVGSIFPLHASATGKTLLAELDETRVQDLLPEELPRYTDQTITTRKALIQELQEVRERGYAILDGELEEGMFAIGLPVRDTGGSMFAILTVTGPKSRLGSDRLQGSVKVAREASEQLSKVLSVA